MFIENVSLFDINVGWHYDPGENSMLIQIVDPDMQFPTPKYNFKVVHQFKFLDIEEEGAMSIKDSQAQEIADALLFAKVNHMNVIVHCHAGICRSGAVAEAGVVLGFNDTEKLRIPNVLVKQKLFKALNNSGAFQ